MKKILAITGKPGLYKFVSRGNKMIIVETIDDNKKRMPALQSDKVVALSDISIYTDDGKEKPLPEVLENIKSVYDAKEIDINSKKASSEEIVEFFGKVLPEYDTDRVHVSDMRKVLQWYNILTKYGLNEFVEKEESNNSEKEDKEK